MDKIIIFTDGSSRGNPGRGGWGTVLIADKKVIELGGREEGSTNNQMELRAILEGLRRAHSFSIKNIDLYTDSSYAINGITKWINNWKKNNWKTKEDNDVLNRDIWSEIDRIKEGLEIKWNLLPGHSGIIGNERCDQIATAFADHDEIDLYEGSLEKYPLKILEIKINYEDKNKKDRSKAKAHSYISLVNGIINIHKTWDECKKRVDGQKGAKYRKSLSREDEEKIIEEFSK